MPHADEALGDQRGDQRGDQLGDPLDGYRSYLRVLAGMQVGPLLRGKLDASDVVQEALLKAHRHRDQYQGTTDAEREAWLRRILANTLADLHRRYSRDKRDVGLERSLEVELEQSSFQLKQLLADGRSTPSQRVLRLEQLQSLATALDELPQAQRLAVTLRYLRTPACSLAEIAAQLGRTEKAAAGLLCRGLESLRRLLHESKLP